MWCAPRSVSCLCFQCVHYLRHNGKSQFPTQHFPWEHGTKIPSVRSFFSLICASAAPLYASARLFGVRTKRKNVRQQGNVSEDFLPFDHWPVHFWNFLCHFVCAFTKKVHKNTKNILF